MIYLLIILSLFLLFFSGMIWLRKVQYDAIHRNLLDLVDRYGGKVIRQGFAVRPKYSGIYQDAKLSISISSEKKSEGGSRRFYISAFMEIPGYYNFTVMSRDWLNLEDHRLLKDRYIRRIADEQYFIEVSEKRRLRELNIPRIESIVEKIIPFAYVLISKKGILLERLSDNLLRDTEGDHLDQLITGMYQLSEVSPVRSSGKSG